jgi:plasmid stability protein
MKITVELPDELIRAVKIRAATEGRKLKDVMAELVQRGLAQESQNPANRRRVSVPLVVCAHPAQPAEEMTPERVAEVLSRQEWPSPGKTA